jgi:FkbM family methyltransferase
MADYYAQFGTDKEIEKYFKGKTGNAIEVGGAQGIAASNTYYFEKLGWKVLCIEPVPELWKQLKINRNHAYQYALSNFHQDGVPFTVVTLKNNDMSAISGLRLDQELYDAHKHIIKNKRQIKVNVRTLDEVIAEFGQFDTIDFVSIDTEGTELDVLKGFDLKKWTPKVLVIENNHDTKDVERYVKKFGYEKKERVGVNDIYQYNNALLKTRKSKDNSSDDPDKT